MIGPISRRNNCMETNNHHPLQPDWAESLTAFALAFGFLHKAFYEEPDEPFIAALVAENLFAEWPVDSDDAETKTGLALLQAFAADWQDDQLSALRRDFARLFVGPDRLLAPPWESVYLSREHLLFEEQTLAVRQFYGRFNLQAPNLNVEPDDHIALEMAFMAHLCTLGLTAVSHNDIPALNHTLQAQHDFLDEHLLRWAPEFCEKVIERADTAYYRGAAHLILGTLHTAKRLLDMALPEVEA